MISESICKGDYFYNEQMEQDEMVQIAGNCFMQLTAVVLKNKVKNLVNFNAVYFDDLTFNLIVDANHQLIRSAIKPNSLNIDKGAFDVHNKSVEQDEEGAFLLVEEVLRREKYVIVRTVDYLLPFSKYYNPEAFDLTTFPRNGHVFMIVGEDQDNFYYIDQLSELNMKNYVHIEGRGDIGVYSKKEFKKVLGLYTRVFWLELFEDKIEHVSDFNRQIIENSVHNYYENFYDRKVEDSDCQVFGGKEALLFFRKMFDDEHCFLNQKVFNQVQGKYVDFDVESEILNGITGIVNRKKLLLNLLRDRNFGDEKLESIVNQDVSAWNILKHLIVKSYLRQEYDIKSFNKIYIDKVVQYEDMLFECLKEYV